MVQGGYQVASNSVPFNLRGGGAMQKSYAVTQLYLLSQEICPIFTPQNNLN